MLLPKLHPPQGFGAIQPGCSGVQRYCLNKPDMEEFCIYIYIYKFLNLDLFATYHVEIKNSSNIYINQINIYIYIMYNINILLLLPLLNVPQKRINVRNICGLTCLPLVDKPTSSNTGEECTSTVTSGVLSQQQNMAPAQGWRWTETPSPI